MRKLLVLIRLILYRFRQYLNYSGPKGRWYFFNVLLTVHLSIILVID